MLSISVVYFGGFNLFSLEAQTNGTFMTVGSKSSISSMFCRV